MNLGSWDPLPESSLIYDPCDVICDLWSYRKVGDGFAVKDEELWLVDTDGLDEPKQRERDQRMGAAVGEQRQRQSRHGKHPQVHADVECHLNRKKHHNAKY